MWENFHQVFRPLTKLFLKEMEKGKISKQTICLQEMSPTNDDLKYRTILTN